MTLGEYGVTVKTSDFPRARWLTPRGTLTQRRLHAGLDTKEQAESVARRLTDHPDVESVSVKKFWKD